MKLKKIRNRFPIYGKKSLKLAFEFGLILSETARKGKVELTPEMSEEAEKILINEFKINGADKTALNFVPLILSILRIK